MQPFFARIFMFVLIILLPAVMSAHLSHLWTAIERQLDHKCNNIGEIRIVEVVTVYMANEHGQVSAEVEFFLFFLVSPPVVAQYLIHLNSRQNRLVWRDFRFIFFCGNLLTFFSVPRSCCFTGGGGLSNRQCV